LPPCRVIQRAEKCVQLVALGAKVRGFSKHARTGQRSPTGT
jgi:hypothetical protein